MPKYIELALGSFNNRATVRTLETLPEYVAAAQAKNLQLFRSLYTFDASLAEYVAKHGSIKGFEGEVDLDEVILDIDGKQGALALHIAREVCERCTHDYLISEDYVQPYFSGTGFHIHIPNLFGLAPSKELPAIVNHTVAGMFPEADNIFDLPRLIRVNGTINKKSGLYKIPLTLSELHSLPIERIWELAKTPRLDFIFTPTESPEPILAKHVVRIHHTPKQIKSTPSKIVTCMQTLFNQGETFGERHQAIMAMTSSFRRAGVPAEGILRLMEQWAPQFASDDPTELHRLVTSVFENDFEYSCHHPLFEKYCSPHCMYFVNKNYDSAFVTPPTMEENFVKFVKTDFSTTAFNLKEFHNLANDYWVYPGEMLLVIGDTGVGKTALVQNWCTKLRPMKVLYYSLEVHERLLFRRFVQIAEKMRKEEVITAYKTEGKKLTRNIDHIRVSTKSPALYDIRRHVGELSPNIVVVDTTDSIVIPKMTGLEREDAIARGLKEIAQQMNVIIIGVHHIAKQNPMLPSSGLTVHSGKGASTWEQKADKVLAFEGKVGNVRSLHSLKARDEQSFLTKMEMHWPTFTLQPLQRI